MACHFQRGVQSRRYFDGQKPERDEDDDSSVMIRSSVYQALHSTAAPNTR